MTTNLLLKSQEILKTLPLAHYLRVSTIKNSLSETAPTSYFDPVNFEIVVAFSNIAEACKGVTFTDEALEKVVRGLLYHEVSHAILTPKDLFEYYFRNCKEFPNLDKNIINILEDERIETLLKHYYLNVDFKDNVRKIITCPTNPTNIYEYLFKVVRHRKGSTTTEKVINWFIKATKDIRAKNAFWNRSYELLCAMNELMKYLNQEFKNELEKNKNQQTENNNDSQPSKDGKESKESESQKTDETKSNDNENESQDSNDEIDDEIESQEIDENELTNDEVAKAFNEVLKDLTVDTKPNLSLYKSDSKAKAEMLIAIASKVGVGVNQTPTMYGLNGKFNVKRYMKDCHQSYKWFEKPSMDGGNTGKRGNKKVLNIWLDQSGSFNRNDESVNQILKGLDEIEKSRDDFEWRLIKVDRTLKIVKDKNQRVSRSLGDNDLPVALWKKVYDETNQTKQELNIVLFDGTASYRTTPEYGYKALKPHNNDRTIFITEWTNEDDIAKNCPKARDIIVENRDYTGKLKENIVRAIKILF